MSMLHVDNVNKIYGSGYTTIKAVQNVSLTIDAGGIVLIIGPSGSGKTTLLSMMGTLLKPTSGVISINGKKVSTMNENTLPQFRLKHIGFMFQSFNLISALTAEQNVMMPLLISGWEKKDASARARKLLERLGLAQRRTHLPRDLSGGEKQRISVARALANNPTIILADEPTANLDSKTGHHATKLLCNIACEEQRAVVIVSHDMRLRDVAKTIYTMEDGKITGQESGGHDATCTMKKHKG
jgi:putative ABC transport system ATP-binding protein